MGRFGRGPPAFRQHPGGGPPAEALNKSPGELGAGVVGINGREEIKNSHVPRVRPVPGTGGDQPEISKALHHCRVSVSLLSLVRLGP